LKKVIPAWAKKTEKIKTLRNTIGKVGIVPVIAPSAGYELDWDDTLIPVAPNYYAIEHAVLRCAYAGCSSVWIMANNNTTPLIRHRIGDYVHDPVYLKRMAKKYPNLQRREVPVMYVPMPPEHETKDQCLSWTCLYGAFSAYWVGIQISKWVTPKRFYVSFPLSMQKADFMRPHRKEIIDAKNVVLTHGGKSILTGDPIDFSFTDEQMDEGISKFKEVSESFVFAEPEEEREHFKENFTLEKVFEPLIYEDRTEFELPWHHDLYSWEGYCNYLSSEERKTIKHPGKLVISYREFHPMGIDVEKTLDEDD
jgi:hypothetical protein